MMKKRWIVFFPVILILLFLVSCKEDIHSSQLEDESKDASYQFIPVDAFLFLADQENKYKLGNTLSFYGYIESDKSLEDLEHIANSTFHTIKLYDKNKSLIAESRECNFRFSPSEKKNKNNYVLCIYLDNKALSEINQKMICYLSMNDEKELKNIGNYNLQTAKIAALDTISLSESPILFADNSIDTANSTRKIGYQIVVFSSKYNSDFDIKISLQDNPRVKIKHFSWKYDKEGTQSIKKLYEQLKPQKEIDTIKVYQLDVDFTLKDAFNIALVPEISIQMDGNKSVCIPSEPLIYLSDFI